MAKEMMAVYYTNKMNVYFMGKGRRKNL